MKKTIYIFLGGAYAESTWVQFTAPDSDQLASWRCGELYIFRVDDSGVFEPANTSGEWQEVHEHEQEGAK